MDERKGTFRVLKFGLLGASIGLSLFLLYAAYVYFTLPKIKDPRKCFVTSMYKVNLCPKNETYVKFKRLPPHLVRALILSEDASFYSHKGLDWFEIKESFRRNIKEWRFARGGSTISQQLAKNLYLNQEKSITRKIKEFLLAKEIEKVLSKSQILEKYFNVVEFGPDIFGINAASRHYFDKAPDSLNVLESAYLISLLPNPKSYGSSFKKRKLSKMNIFRMKIILGRLYRTQKISDEIFVFSEQLIDGYEWPFPHYSNPFHDDIFDSVEEELLQELGEHEDGVEPSPVDYEQEVIDAVKEYEEAYGDDEPVAEEEAKPSQEQAQEKEESILEESETKSEADPEVTPPPQEENSSQLEDDNP